MANIDKAYTDKVEARKIAQDVLARLKKKENVNKRYVWKIKGTEVSHPDPVRLKELVENLGYVYSEGVIISPTE